MSSPLPQPSSPSIPDNPTEKESNEQGQSSGLPEPNINLPSLVENPTENQSSEQGKKSPISEPKSPGPQPLALDPSDFPIVFTERVENYRRLRHPHKMPDPLLIENYDPYPPNDFPSPIQVDRASHTRRGQDAHTFRCPRHYRHQRQYANPPEDERDCPCEDCLKQYVPLAANPREDSVESAQQQPPPPKPYYPAWPASLYAPGGYYYCYPAYPPPEKQLHHPPPYLDWGSGAGNPGSPVTLYSRLSSLHLGSCMLDLSSEFIVLAGGAKRSQQDANAYAPSSPSQSAFAEPKTPAPASIDGDATIHDGDQHSIVHDGA
jgi:hypothetical protein